MMQGDALGLMGEADSDIDQDQMPENMFDLGFDAHNSADLPDSTFEDNGLKSLPTLLLEINHDSRNDAHLKELSQEGGYLELTVKDIYNKILGDSILSPQAGNIYTWDQAKIMAWSKDIQEKKVVSDPNNLAEILAVLNRANYLHTAEQSSSGKGYYLRDIQMISTLILLESGDKGILSQIHTGEGKSTIVSLVASIFAMRGENVDIITSSPILAARDAKDKIGFYQMLGLSCDDNTHYSPQDRKPKDCYKANIVYGDTGNFQYDWLKTTYNDLNIRNDRSFGICLVDEVDSMLIDEGGKIAKLSSRLAGIEYVQAILVPLWQQLQTIETQYYYDQATETLCWSNGEDIYQVEDRAKFSTQLLKSQLDQIISDGIELPKHISDLIQQQKERWITSAIQATNMEEDRNYVILTSSKDSKTKIIAPIDYQSTGVTQSNTQWSNGLHQFLQIKHGLKMTPESLSSCFISNMGYFKIYGQKIYGMTGTLGSIDSQKLFKEIYNIDLAFMPTHKPSHLSFEDDIICDSGADHLLAIQNNVLLKIQQGRSCLVICETIEDCKELEQALKASSFDGNKLLSYYRSDLEENASKLAESLGPGYVIIATNLAGRGTDIKTTAMLEQNGGLAVILTFLPTNKRVEDQATGRTARCGNEGSSIMILNQDYELMKLVKLFPASMEPQNIANFDIPGLKYLRDIVETARLDEIKENKARKLALQDDLFNAFNSLVHEFKGNPDNEGKLLQVEELWGIWFKAIIEKETYSREFEKQTLEGFNAFCADIRATINNGNQIIKNAIYLIMQGFNEMSSGSYDKAIGLFKEAIALDDKFTFAAHYNLAYAILRKLEKDKKVHATEAFQVRDHLLKCKEQIEQYVLPIWQLVQIIIDSEFADSPLMKQMQTKTDLLNLQIRYIDNAADLINQEGNDKLIRIKAPKLLKDLFGPGESPDSEIEELNAAGVLRLYEVEAKKPPTNYFSNIAIAVIGVVQGIVGTLMTIGSVGVLAKISLGMIVEGVMDVYKSVKASIAGKALDWAEYWIDKAISYAAIIIAAGVQSINDASNAATATSTLGKTSASAASSSVVKEVAKGAAKEITAKTLFQEVAKEAVMKIAKQEALAVGVKLASGLLDNYKDSMKKDAAEDIREVLMRADVNAALRNILMIDQAMGRNENHVKLNNAIKEYLEPLGPQLFDISKKLFQAASNAGTAVKVAGAAMEMGSRAADLVEFGKIVDRFCNHLAQIILNLSQGTKSLTIIIAGKLRVTPEQVAAKLIITAQQSSNILKNEREFSDEFIQAVMNKDNNAEAKAKYDDLFRIIFRNFLSVNPKGQIAVAAPAAIINMVRSTQETYADQIQQLAISYSGVLSGQMMSKLQAAVMQPTVKVATDFTVDHIASELKAGSDRKEQRKLEKEAAEEQKLRQAIPNLEGYRKTHPKPPTPAEQESTAETPSQEEKPRASAKDKGKGKAKPDPKHNQNSNPNEGASKNTDGQGGQEKAEGFYEFVQANRAKDPYYELHLKVANDNEAGPSSRGGDSRQSSGANKPTILLNPQQPASQPQWGLFGTPSAYAGLGNDQGGSSDYLFDSTTILAGIGATGLYYGASSLAPAFAGGGAATLGGSAAFGGTSSGVIGSIGTGLAAEVVLPAAIVGGAVWGLYERNKLYDQASKAATDALKNDPGLVDAKFSTITLIKASSLVSPPPLNDWSYSSSDNDLEIRFIAVGLAIMSNELIVNKPGLSSNLKNVEAELTNQAPQISLATLKPKTFHEDRQDRALRAGRPLSGPNIASGTVPLWSASYGMPVNNSLENLNNLFSLQGIYGQYNFAGNQINPFTNHLNFANITSSNVGSSESIVADSGLGDDTFEKKNQNKGKVASDSGSKFKDTTISPMPDPGDFEPDDEEGKERKTNCNKAESPVWQELKSYKGGVKTNGLTGKNQRFYQWDYLHNDIEVFDKSYKHLGSMNPINGKMYKGPKGHQVKF